MLTRYKQAFLEPLHLLTLTGIAAMTPAFGDPLPIFLAGAGEALYLIYVPDSRWYTALQNRRAVTARRTAREKLNRELLPFADQATRSASARLELIYSGYLAGANAMLPETMTRYERLLEQHIRFVAKEAAFEKQMREMARASDIPDEVSGVHRDGRIVAYSLEQIALCRELLQSVGETARGSNVADAGRQIALMEERIAYIETASRLREDISRERAAIETAFLRLTNADPKGDTDDTDTLERTSERLHAKLEQFAPHEARVSQLIGA